MEIKLNVKTSDGLFKSTLRRFPRDGNIDINNANPPIMKTRDTLPPAASG